MLLCHRANKLPCIIPRACMYTIIIIGTPSVFNIVIDCCNQTRVNVQWVRVRSEAGINWLYLDYHCSSSNETFEVSRCMRNYIPARNHACKVAPVRDPRRAWVRVRFVRMPVDYHWYIYMHAYIYRYTIIYPGGIFLKSHFPSPLLVACMHACMRLANSLLAVHKSIYRMHANIWQYKSFQF